MNGVAKQFWSEVYDLKAPVTDDSRARGSSSSKRKSARKNAVRRPHERAA